MKLIGTIIGASLALTFGVGNAAATDPGKLLSGHSAMHPAFGCLYFRDDGVTIQLPRGGEPREGRWGAKEGLYYSSGQCGTIGCKIEGKYPELIFKRVDGGYKQPAMLVPGNHCSKNATFT